MPLSPRSLAIIWAIACLCDIATVIILTVSLINRPNHRDWYYIILVVAVSMMGCGAAFSAWRSWRLHHSQRQVFVPLVHSQA
ncbi:hypothetical protein DFH09DRAFT_1185392 [Mycena vulgaris]|nr:hypothetical protein DFH09DRAFT_1185392 [Mycena vulgaris]